MTTFPEGFIARAPTLVDAPAVADLLSACERARGGERKTSVDEVLNDWKAIDLADEAILVTTRDGEAAAFADVLNRGFVLVSVYGSVHPRFLGQGLGTALAQWGETWTLERMHRAPAGAAVSVRHYLPAGEERAQRLLESMGYRAVRTTYVMTRSLVASPRPPVWPDEIRVRTYLSGVDDERAFAAHEEASRDMWGRPPSTLNVWRSYVGRTDPTLIFVAEDERTGEIAGICGCRLTSNTGEVESLRVRKAWRRQGLGLALLRHAFQQFHARGAADVRLCVDAESPTGAPRLYARAGMEVAESYHLFEKELRPGVDLAQRATA